MQYAITIILRGGLGDGGGGGGGGGSMCILVDTTLPPSSYAHHMLILLLFCSNYSLFFSFSCNLVEIELMEL